MRTKILFISFVLFGLIPKRTSACIDFDADYAYFNLFSQELINAPQYVPYLLTADRYFYVPTDSVEPKQNGNIEEWADYLGIPYQDAHHLVFEAKREELQALCEGKKTGTGKLAFVTPTFVKSHQDALQYLRYAKYLEPYMRIISNKAEDDWEYPYGERAKYPKKITEIDYGRMTRLFAQKWGEVADKELKLRYGYQMVRLAHYFRKYSEAINFFDKYVQPLNFKPEMYYYALSQKAGAERGYMQDEYVAYGHFMQVFTHSKDLKESAYCSIFLRHDEEVDLASLLATATTDDERNDIHLILAFRDFNNPLSELYKVIVSTPDATQAKVLMARAINSIERDLIPDSERYSLAGKDKRYPIVSPELRPYLDSTLVAAQKVANITHKDKDFWNLSAAYLYFLQKDYTLAKKTLSTVSANTLIYQRHKSRLSAYIYLAEQPRITEAVERHLYANYPDEFKRTKWTDKMYDDDYWATAKSHGSFKFMLNVLANRYYLQGDEAKAFLLTNSLSNASYSPTEAQVDALERFYKKAKKNDFEQCIAQAALDDKTGKDGIAYLAYVRGVLKLTAGNFAAAVPLFEKFTRLTVPNCILGYNIRVWFHHDAEGVMQADYVDGFPFIKSKMNELDVAKALVQLQKIGKGNNEKAAEANYLIGNFFYNVSTTGYFRQYLRFDNNNSYWGLKYYLDNCDLFNENPYKYPDEVSDECTYEDPDEDADEDTDEDVDEKEKNTEMFLIDYSTQANYTNTISLAMAYLEKAAQIAKSDELRAHIAFAQSEVEQQVWDRQIDSSPWSDTKGEDILISNRKAFKELAKYKNTKFYAAVQSHCKYFDYYVNHN